MWPNNNDKSLLIILHVTDKCNLRCSYCYSEKSNRDMPLAVAYKTVDRLTEFRKYFNYVTIAFSGGEPLMVFDNVSKIVKYARRRGINNFIICTNGVILNREKIKFFVAYNISPTISIDGISWAQNYNRPFFSSKKSWSRLNQTLNLFDEYLENFNKRRPDYLRLRCTLTPETIPFLYKSVCYLLSKPIGLVGMITLMPGMLPIERWKVLSEDKFLRTTLDNQLSLIIKLYAERKKQGRPFRLCFNECLTIRPEDLIGCRSKVTMFSCRAGVTKLGVGLSGDIYPCYLFSASFKENKKFCLGNIFDDSVDWRKAAGLFSNSITNPSGSCWYWNKKVTGNFCRPALPYKLIYESLRRAVKNAWPR